MKSKHATYKIEVDKKKVTPGEKLYLGHTAYNIYKSRSYIIL